MLLRDCATTSRPFSICAFWAVVLSDCIKNTLQPVLPSCVDVLCSVTYGSDVQPLILGLALCAQLEAMGVQEEEDGDYKAASRFKDHMKASEAASDFSRNKSIAEQRRSLPVYQVRDDLVQVD